MPKVMLEPTHIAAARLLVKTARTADELRQAQAVLFPGDLRLTLAQTARAIGRTVAVTSNLRRDFANGDVRSTAVRSSRPRTPEHAKIERERHLLVGVLRSANTSGDLAIATIKPLLEAQLGTTVSVSTVYRTLARHGWRKNAPFPTDLLAEAGQAPAYPWPSEGPQVSE